ncbi:MAG TPA: response regulator [Solirubrobacteraceae bacterium]|nr:response regulator [Solirubrobacteraceae bacterium]
MPQVTVPIVDDAAVMRRLARELLERRGYTVVAEADCAATALSLADALLPDAVLLDVRLPDADGFDVAAAMTSASANGSPAVLMMTADPQLAHYAMLDRSGARGLVSKADLAGTDLGAFWPVP